MNKAADNKPPTGGKGAKSTMPDNWVVAVQLLDTGWRVALPILLLTYLGTRLDRSWDTEPYFVLVGFFLSLALATLLVYRQVHRAYPEFFTSIKRGKNK